MQTPQNIFRTRAKLGADNETTYNLKTTDAHAHKHTRTHARTHGCACANENQTPAQVNAWCAQMSEQLFLQHRSSNDVCRNCGNKALVAWPQILIATHQL